MSIAFVLATFMGFGIALPGLPQSTFGTSTPILVTATPADSTVVDRAPFVVEITIANTKDVDIDIALDLDHPNALDEASTLELTSSDGAVHRLRYTGKPQTNRYRLPIRRTMKAGTVARFDRVFAPLSWVRNSDTHTYGHEFVPPGVYTGRVLIGYDAGHSVSSEPFELRVSEPAGDDERSRDMVTVEIAAFLYGGEPPTRANGPAKVQLEKITRDHPDSVYAGWIRFWTVYHKGSEDEALAYAREHPGFPLSDNLMFRVAERVADDDARREQASMLLAELRRLFPKGDAANRAERLRQQLENKPRR